MTAENGRLPEAVLTVADSGPNGPQRLRLDAAASRRRMIRDGCPAGHLRSGYRDLVAQAAEVARARAGLTPSAALPGTSGHGEGIDTDDDPPAREWITAHGAPYGWVSDLIPDERWHHEYWPATDQHAHVPSPASVPPLPAPSSTPLDPTTEDPDMRLIRTPDGQIRSVTTLSIQPVTDMTTAQALGAVWGTWVNVDEEAYAAILAQIQRHIVDTAANLRAQGV